MLGLWLMSFTVKLYSCKDIFFYQYHVGHQRAEMITFLMIKRQFLLSSKTEIKKPGATAAAISNIAGNM